MRSRACSTRHLSLGVLKVVNSRLWLEKADWTSWTNTLEDLSKDIMEIDDCNEIWSRIKQSISEASDKFFPTKKSCHHSNPFWNADLSAASKEVSKCRKQFRLNSNYSNGLALDSAKEHFKTSLALEASNWMQHLLREFGYKKGKYFWKTYNRLYKKTLVKLVPSELPRINLHARSKRLLTISEKNFRS